MARISLLLLRFDTSFSIGAEAYSYSSSPCTVTTRILLRVEAISRPLFVSFRARGSDTNVDPHRPNHR